MSDDVVPFNTYLELVRKDPSIVKTAHMRVYEAIMKKGVNLVFGDFYGMDDTVRNIMHYLRAAALGGEMSRRFLFLMGPPSSGKSSLIRTLAWAIHGETTYSIDDCPMRDQPLHLLPREKLHKLIAEHKLMLPEGDVCPLCRRRLKDEFRLDWTKFTVRKNRISVRASRGFASVDPTDPMSFDKAKLIGAVTLGEKEGDPEHFELDGAFCRANGGIIEFVELFKNPPEVLYPLIEATQSKTIESPGRTEKMSIDVVIIGHSNEAEWIKFSSEKRNEALIDRLYLVRVPHNIHLRDQVRILKKISIAEPRANVRYHVNPLSLEIVAAFAVLTRLNPSERVENMIDKMLIYNGELTSPERPTPQQLLQEKPRDGWKGISNRDAAEILEKALSNQPVIPPICVDPTAVLGAIDNFVTDHAPASKEEGYWTNLSTALKEWLKIKAKEHFCKLAEQCEELSSRTYEDYRKAIELLLRKQPVDAGQLFLVQTVELELNQTHQNEDELNQLRELMLHQPNYADAAELIKTGVCEYVVNVFLTDILKKTVLKEQDEEEDADIHEWRTFIETTMQTQNNYCPLCIKRVAEYLFS